MIISDIYNALILSRRVLIYQYDIIYKALSLVLKLAYITKISKYHIQ
jgi:hypothetical protein